MSPIGAPRRRLALLLQILALPVSAADLTTTAAVRFTTDYVFRGYSKSADHPAIQAHVGVSDARGVFGGIWLSQIDFGGATLEFQPYLGYRRELTADLRLDVVAVGYLYDRPALGRRADYAETALSLTWKELVTLRASTAFNTYGSSVATGNLEWSGRYPLSDILEITGGMGFDGVVLVTDYDVIYWHAGARYFLGQHLVVDLSYLDKAWTREDFHPKPGGRFDHIDSNGRVVLSVTSASDRGAPTSTIGTISGDACGHEPCACRQRLTAIQWSGRQWFSARHKKW